MKNMVDLYKKITNKMAFLALYSCLFLACEYSGSETLQSVRNLKIRDLLFDFSYIDKTYEPINQHMLGKLEFSSKKNVKIPKIALHQVKKTNISCSMDRNNFIKSVASTVNWVNHKIANHRQLVLAVKNKKAFHKALTSKESVIFDAICEFYQSKNIDDLLMRIAPVSVSLAVAQASLESGFGSNSKLHKHNAFFGMTKNNGYLFSYETLFESVIAYAKTINVNPIYRHLRLERSKLISQKSPLYGEKLSKYLFGYSECSKYTSKINSLIREYNLHHLDDHHII